MFRIPILIALAGLTSFFLYKNEKQRVAVQENGTEEVVSSNVANVAVAPREDVFGTDSDDYGSDTSASLDEMDLRN